MAEREAFIERIRGRLHHRKPQEEYRPTHAPDVPWTRSGDPREEPGMEDAPARFLRELEALGGHGGRVAGLGEAREYVLALVRERGASLLVRWDEELLEELGVDAPLAKAGVEVAVWRGLPDFRKVLDRAQVGLTTAEYAVAETGSVAIAGGPGRGRSVTLLPPTHVAVLPVGRLVRTVSEVIGLYAEGELPANVCLHSGPSRSGDIEQSLAIGVHGPGDVHVLLVG